MIKPYLLKAGRSKQSFAGWKVYRPCVQLRHRLFYSKRIFKRASQARSYAERLIAGQALAEAQA